MRSVIIKVRDEGPGIPGDLTERIFEPFFTTKTSSAGMGLAISRRIALDHGDRLVAVEQPHRLATDKKGGAEVFPRAPNSLNSD